MNDRLRHPAPGSPRGSPRRIFRESVPIARLCQLETAAKTRIARIGKVFATDFTDGFQSKIPSSVPTVKSVVHPPRHRGKFAEVSRLIILSAAQSQSLAIVFIFRPGVASKRRRRQAPRPAPDEKTHPESPPGADVPRGTIGRSCLLVHNRPQPPVGYKPCYLILEIHNPLAGPAFRCRHPPLGSKNWSRYRHGFWTPCRSRWTCSKKRREFAKNFLHVRGGMWFSVQQSVQNIPLFFHVKHPICPPKSSRLSVAKTPRFSSAVADRSHS